MEAAIAESIKTNVLWVTKPPPALTWVLRNDRLTIACLAAVSAAIWYLSEPIIVTYDTSAYLNAAKFSAAASASAAGRYRRAGPSDLFLVHLDPACSRHCGRGADARLPGRDFSLTRLDRGRAVHRYVHGIRALQIHHDGGNLSVGWCMCINGQLPSSTRDYPSGHAGIILLSVSAWHDRQIGTDL
jgi:hypothetical protein